MMGGDRGLAPPGDQQAQQDGKGLACRANRTWAWADFSGVSET